MTDDNENGDRCGECRLGLGVHNPLDTRCAQYQPLISHVAERLLLAMDGDYLPDANLCDRDSEDVPFDRARPKEVMHWAAREAVEALSSALAAPVPETLPEAGWLKQEAGRARSRRSKVPRWARPAPAPAVQAESTGGLSVRQRYAMAEAREPDCEMWVNGLVEVYDTAPDSDDMDRDQRIDISVSALAALVAEREVEAILTDRAARDAVQAREVAEARADELRQAADEVASALATEVGGHTSTYSVRAWLRSRAARLARAGGEG